MSTDPNIQLVKRCFADELPKARFRAEPLVIAAAGDHVIDVHRDWATYEDAALDIHWVHVHRIENGHIKQVENFAADQHRADAFFWRVWSPDLKPIPDRLTRPRPPVSDEDESGPWPAKGPRSRRPDRRDRLPPRPRGAQPARPDSPRPTSPQHPRSHVQGSDRRFAGGASR